MIPWLIATFLFDGGIDALIDYDDRIGGPVPLWGWLALLLFCVLMLWIYFAIVTKRLHDRDKSARWLILSVIPIIGYIWVIVEFSCLRRTTGPNRYDASPSFET